MGYFAVLTFAFGLLIGAFAVMHMENTVNKYVRDLIDSYERRILENNVRIDNLMFPDRVEAPLLQQPDTSVPDELLMAYGVTNVSDLPRDVRAVWDKDYNGGGVQ